MKVICFAALLILLLGIASLTASEQRVLVIAPHCDDETLSCGGLISRLVKEDVPVRVIIVTNGDAFNHPVSNLKRDPSGFIELGEMRRKESLAALEKLGVPGSSVIFMGYPDRCLAGMWLYYWPPNKPVKSRYTHCSRSPYEKVFHPHAPYYGRSLLADLEAILRSYRPTTVYYPHPLDIHSDHWAVNCFATEALYDTGMLENVKSCLYVVHGAEKLLTKGYDIRLSKTESEVKRAAVMEYKTQIPVMGGFLKNFSKASEVFRPQSVCAITKVKVKEWPDWDAVPRVLEDPAQESRFTGVIPGGDFTELKCCYDDRFVYLRVRLARPHSKWLAYRFSLVGMPDATGERANVSVTEKGCSGSGARGRMEGNTIEVAVPMSRLGRWKALMVSADSAIFSRKVDRTAWQVLVPGGISKLLPGPSAIGQHEAITKNSHFVH